MRDCVVLCPQVLCLPMLEHVERQVIQMEVLKQLCSPTSLMSSVWPTAQCWYQNQTRAASGSSWIPNIVHQLFLLVLLHLVCSNVAFCGMQFMTCLAATTVTVSSIARFMSTSPQTTWPLQQHIYIVHHQCWLQPCGCCLVSWCCDLVSYQHGVHFFTI